MYFSSSYSFFVFHFPSFFPSTPAPTSLAPFLIFLSICFISSYTYCFSPFLHFYYYSSDYFNSSSVCRYSSPTLFLPPLFHSLFPPSALPPLLISLSSIYSISCVHFSPALPHSRMLPFSFLSSYFIMSSSFSLSSSFLFFLDVFLFISVVSLLFSLTPFPFLFLFHLHSLLLLLFLSLLISFHCLDSYNCAFSA